MAVAAGSSAPAGDDARRGARPAQGRRSTGTSESYLGCLFMSRNFIKLALKYAGFSFPLWMANWLFDNILKPSIKFDRVAIAASIQSLFSLRTPGEELVRSITSR